MENRDGPGVWNAGKGGGQVAAASDDRKAGTNRLSLSGMSVTIPSQASTWGCGAQRCLHDLHTTSE